MIGAPELRFTLRSAEAEHLLDRELVRARLVYWEQPAAALEVAIRCQEQGRVLLVPALQSRALALQGAICLHRGDLGGAFALAAEAERVAGEDLTGRAELAALNTHLHFFSGSYGESMRQAEQAVDLADRAGDTGLRLHARRMACLAFANMGVEDLPRRLEELLALAVEGGDPWEEAISHNDLGHLRMTEGDLVAAAEHLATGMRIAHTLEPHNHFLLGVLHCTRAELSGRAGGHAYGLADAEWAITHLTAERDVNPYLLGMAVLVKVQTLLTLGRLDAARCAGEKALDRLGDHVPQARSMILSAVAGALHEAGRFEEAYDALARGAELERQALQEFSQLQMGLERARLEMAAARREADALSAKNRELERLQEQLRDQADRDFLTGLRNRRYLARVHDARVGPASLAVVDLDHFKAINDRFGHGAGDRVLVRVAELLVEHLRAEDIIVRTGGEEFAVLMPGTSEHEAGVCCERLRAMIAAEDWFPVAPGLAVTASIGVVSAPAEFDIAELERVADQRLYAAKRAGRNRVVGLDAS
jgi:diguanylate cyclase (GGDEF)-like protein